MDNRRRDYRSTPAASYGTNSHVIGLSQRTAENHRAMIMKKTGSHSIPALTRLVLASELGG
jgi:DNA-binding CsgD family transcriptional regulator